jgi:hypothetical protein
MVIKTDIALYLINKLGLTVTEAIELGECSLISGYLDYRIVYNGFDNKSVDWIILSSDAGLCIYEADYKQAKINIEKGMYRFIK